MNFKRLIGNVLKGVVKSIPVVNLVYESAKDLNRKDTAERTRRILDSRSFQEKMSNETGLKKSLYNAVDLLDDGKINESFDQLLFDRIIQIVSGAIALIIGAIQLYQNLGG